MHRLSLIFSRVIKLNDLILIHSLINYKLLGFAFLKLANMTGMSPINTPRPTIIVTTIIMVVVRITAFILCVK